MIVQLSELLLSYLLLRESFPLNRRSKLYSFEDIFILSLKPPILLHEVLLHYLMTA